jgi:hypothetical protein
VERLLRICNNNNLREAAMMRMVRRVLYAAAVVLTGATIGANALEFIATTGIAGRAMDVKCSGNYAYIADQYGIMVLDLSAPQAPAFVGRVAVGGTAESVTVSGLYGYLGAGAAGMEVVDLSNPYAPNREGGIPDIHSAYQSAAQGNLLFVVGGDEGLSILDLDTPSAPLKIGGYTPQSWLQAVGVGATGMCAAADAAVIHLLDCSNPTTPSLISQIVASGCYRRLILQGDLLVAAAQDAGVRIWDVTQPEQPELIGAINTGGWTTDAVLQEDTLFVCDWITGITVYDIADPRRPDLICSFTPHGFPQGMALRDSLLVLAVGDEGVEVWNIHEISNPLFTGTMDEPGSPQDALFDPEGWIYEAAGDAGLRIWDGNLSTSEPIAQLDTPGWANSLALSSNWIYLADGFSGVHVYPRSQHPSEAYAITLENYAGRLAVLPAGVVYCSQSDGGIFSFRIEGLSQPELYGYTPTQAATYSLAARQDLLISCEGIAGFEIFATADPGNVQWLGSAQPEGGAWCAVLVNDLAYIGTGFGGLVVYDLTDPQMPQELGALPGIGWVQALMYNGFDRVVACNGTEGIHLLETAAPLPVIVDVYDTPGFARNASFNGNQLIIADELDLTLLGGVTHIAMRREAPASHAVLSCFPNPFNPAATIQIGLDTAAQIRLTVYDVLGHKVASLLEGRVGAGSHTWNWLPQKEIASGSYLLCLEVDGKRTIRSIRYVK